MDEKPSFLQSLLKESADVLDKYATQKAAEAYKNRCFEVFSFDKCKKFISKVHESYPTVAGMVISVKNNPTALNQNDNLIITIGYLDENNRPIVKFEGDALSFICFAKTLDQVLIDRLNGADTTIIRFKFKPKDEVQK